eukprot:TRINITY_DN13659_c0_g1_i1.p1 TRINITY_DN13659_c0_g1~~TRINITY_DN13659_c0_g1_i1.p1  ORF type:complete len:221 (+),score=39.68 TRINITY_DN13659_c0_g1_i1:68-730(+)
MGHATSCSSDRCCAQTSRPSRHLEVDMAGDVSQRSIVDEDGKPLACVSGSDTESEFEERPPGKLEILPALFPGQYASSSDSEETEREDELLSSVYTERGSMQGSSIVDSALVDDAAVDHDENSGWLSCGAASSQAQSRKKSRSEESDAEDRGFRDTGYVGVTALKEAMSQLPRREIAAQNDPSVPFSACLTPPGSQATTASATTLEAERLAAMRLATHKV